MQEMGLTYFKLLAQHFCVNTEENYETIQNVWLLDL